MRIVNGLLGFLRLNPVLKNMLLVALIPVEHRRLCLEYLQMYIQSTMCTSDLRKAFAKDVQLGLCVTV